MIQHKMVKKILFTYEQIEKETIRVANEINNDYKDNETTPILLGILRGAIPFFSLLLKNIEVDVITDFMLASSYRGGLKSTGSLKVILDVNVDIADRDIIIVEDIVDTGLTVNQIKKNLLLRGAKSVKIATMLNKLDVKNRDEDIQPDYKAFDVENEFVIGFGLDLEEKLRNLPYIAICDTSKLEEFKNEK